ncbi:MAG: hypothetical protein NT080_02905 [Spirochaetes bacterium]|nr:hypothetical protein [Spirochaetota bacterium]
MEYDQARRIFSNLKPVYDLMGGDLVTACIDEGIPPDLIRALMTEWNESQEAIDQALGVMPDDPEAEKRIDDDLMRRFEAHHDDFGDVILNKKLSSR